MATMHLSRPPALAALLILTAFQVAALGQTITVGTNGPDTTDSTNYSGGVSLVKVGTNTVTLTGSNSYTGATTVSNGVLGAGVAGAFSTNTTFTLNGGTIDLGATTQSIWKIQVLSGIQSQTNGSLTTLLPSLRRSFLPPLRETRPPTTSRGISRNH